MHSHKISEKEQRLQIITNRLASLQESNPDLTNFSYEKYLLVCTNNNNAVKEFRILKEKIISERAIFKQMEANVKASPTEFGYEQLQTKFNLIKEYTEQYNNILAKINRLDSEKAKYQNYTEYLDLLRIKDELIDHINKEKEQAIFSGLEPTNDNKNRALQKVDILLNLNFEWCNKFCNENNLTYSKNNCNEVQFKSSDNKIDIVVQQYCVKGICANEATIDLMIKIYLKGIEKSLDIFNHSISHSNGEIKNIAERKLALALKENNQEVKINGKSIDEILAKFNNCLNKNDSDSKLDAINENLSNNSIRLR